MPLLLQNQVVEHYQFSMQSVYNLQVIIPCKFISASEIRMISIVNIFCIYANNCCDAKHASGYNFRKFQGLDMVVTSECFFFAKITSGQLQFSI